MELTRDEVAAITSGRSIGPDAVATGFAFDSRSLQPGEAFVAIRAERDGNDFVADALARGATVALVERVPENVEGSFVLVDDTGAALRALGVANACTAGRRRRHRHHRVGGEDLDEGSHRGRSPTDVHSPHERGVVQQ